jgi:hypothetical protein
MHTILIRLIIILSIASSQIIGLRQYYTRPVGKDALRPASSALSDGNERLLDNFDRELSSIAESIQSYGSGEISIEDFIKQSGLITLLHTDTRMVFSTKNRKYIVKIYLVPNGGYNKEKNFYKNVNPNATPKLFYFDDNAHAFIIQNLDSTRLVDQFLFMQTPDATLSQIEYSIKSSARNIAGIHNKDIEQVGRKVGKENFKGILEDVNSAISQLRNDGFDDPLVPGYLGRFSDVASDEDLVYNHGDYLPWNIFVDPESGHVEALIDAEFGQYDSRAKELANVILGYIDARKNNPLLISQARHLISIFIDEYVAASGVDRQALMSILPFYMVNRLIIGAQVSISKWNIRDWAKWRLQLAHAISQLDTFTIDGLFDCLDCNIKKHQISWAGDITTEYGNASGKTIKIKRGDGIRVYVRVKIEDAQDNPLLATNISACIWTNLHSKTWRAFYPLEFLHSEGNNYLFAATIKPFYAGRYEFTARFSTNAEKAFSSNKHDTGHYAQIPYGNVILDVETSVAELSSRPEVVVVGDTHAEFRGLRESLHESGITHKGATYKEDRLIFDDIIFGHVGDLVDRGHDPVRTYLYLKTLMDNNKRSFQLLGNHELEYLRGSEIPPDRSTKKVIDMVGQDILSGRIKAAYALNDRIVVHGGILPHITADIVRKLKPDFIDNLAKRLNKMPVFVTADEIALAVNRGKSIISFEEIAHELNSRLIDAVRNNNFEDMIFNRGNAHFGPKKRGEIGYEPGGIFWADFDDELSLVDENLLLAQIVGHKEGRRIRWTKTGRVIDVNMIHLYGKGRNTGLLIQGEDKIWRAVYYDNNVIEIVPEAATTGLYTTSSIARKRINGVAFQQAA